MNHALLLSVLAVIAAPSVALACSCAPPPPPEVAAQGATAVVLATVTAGPTAADPNADSKVPGMGGPVVWTFDVIAAWKGSDGGVLEVVTNGHSAACGRVYEAGRSYLLYLSAADDGRFRDSLCTRSRTEDRAVEDKAALGTPAWTRGATPAETAPDAAASAPADGAASTDSGGAATPADEPATDAPADDSVAAAKPVAAPVEPVTAAEAPPAEAPPAPEDSPDEVSKPGCSVAGSAVGLLALLPLAVRRRVDSPAPVR